MEPKKKQEVWHIRLDNLPSNYTEWSSYDGSEFDEAFLQALLDVVSEIADQEEQEAESDQILAVLERLDETVKAEHLPDTEQLILDCYRKYQDE